MPAEGTVHIVEDDAAMRDALSRLLAREGMAVCAFASAEDFLHGFDRMAGGCLLADVRLAGKSGIELMNEVLRAGARLPVILITGHGDIPMAVAAIKAGAFDFIEKPFNPEQLVRVVKAAIGVEGSRDDDGIAAAEIAARAVTLSPREREVMEMVVRGHPNKVIAAELGISPRTVEVYRANVMSKMGARNLPDLIAIGLRLRTQLRNDP
jgi:two-component system response regulator FixJ